MSDSVNSPQYYCAGQFECIDVMLETQGLEDVKKANWYLNKYIELAE